MSDDALKCEIVEITGAEEAQVEQRIASEATPKSTQGRRSGYAVPNAEASPNPQTGTAEPNPKNAPKQKTTEQ
jgi:hypothetical protein